MTADTYLSRLLIPALAAVALAATSSAASAALGPVTHALTPPSGSFAEGASEPFGKYGGVRFTRHTGVFEGTTSLGAFRAPTRSSLPSGRRAATARSSWSRPTSSSAPPAATAS